MNVIGIETATEYLSAAIFSDGVCIERTIQLRSSHCELLAGFITELSAEAKVALDEVDGIAVSRGPGSFTGLRIGIATAMGLSYGLGVPLAGVDTLAALAHRAGQEQTDTLVCPVIDARRREVYTAVYRLRSSLPVIVSNPAAIPAQDMPAFLAGFGEAILVTGPAIETIRGMIPKPEDIPLYFASIEKSTPSASNIAIIGAHLIRRGECGDPADVQPFYLRRSDAEILRDRSCGQSG